MQAKDRRNVASPKCKKSKAEGTKPKQAGLLAKGKLPSGLRSITRTVKSTRTLPKTSAAKPRRAKDLKGVKESKCVNCKTKVTGSMQTKLRTNTKKSKCKKSKTNEDNPVRVQPEENRIKPN